MGGIFNVTDSVTCGNPNAAFTVHVKTVYGIGEKVRICIQLRYRFVVSVEDGYSASISSYPEFSLPVTQDAVYRLVR